MRAAVEALIRARPGIRPVEIANTLQMEKQDVVKMVDALMQRLLVRSAPVTSPAGNPDVGYWLSKDRRDTKQRAKKAMDLLGKMRSCTTQELRDAMGIEGMQSPGPWLRKYSNEGLIKFEDGRWFLTESEPFVVARKSDGTMQLVRNGRVVATLTDAERVILLRMAGMR